MNYFQFNNHSEIEKHVLKRGPSFVTEDLRTHDEIELWDEHSKYYLNIKEINALIILKDTIEFLGRDAERPFTELVRDAKLAQNAFKKVQALLKSRKTLKES